MAEAEAFAIGGEALPDLRGERAGRGEDQRPDRALAFHWRRSGELLKHRQRERGGQATRRLRPQAGGASGAKPTDDPTRCDYWRYCGVDGFLCACCGGSASSCPPGTEPSKASWIGTCRNPHDGRDYIVNYQDCCGKTACGKCLCNTNVGERPGYRMPIHNDVNWCMANDSTSFHCTVSAVVGLAEK